jgi:hypothetical protein
MVSSLAHVLVVTPVIFFWLRERQYGLRHEPLEVSRPQGQRTVARPWRRVVLVGGVLLIAAAALVIWKSPWDRRLREASAGSVIQSVQAGELTISLVSASGPLRQGRNAFTVEFRRGDTVVDVGRVSASANMPMPGMVMSSGLQLEPSGVRGRYAATAEFGMAGAWQFAFQWNGPAGRGSASFEGMVQ